MLKVFGPEGPARDLGLCMTMSRKPVLLSLKCPLDLP